MSGPIYGPDYDAPVVDESALSTLPVGLYRVKGQHRRGDYVDIIRDVTLKDVDQVLLARVDDDKTYLPSGVERAEIRPDGKRLIMAWVLAERWRGTV